MLFNTSIFHLGPDLLVPGLVFALLTALCLLQAWTDSKHRSLPDLLAFWPLAPAVALAGADLGLVSLRDAVVGAALCPAVLVLGWALSCVMSWQRRWAASGARCPSKARWRPPKLPWGDLGLFAQAGCWLGLEGGLQAILLAAFLSPLIMAIRLAAHHGSSRRWQLRLRRAGLPFSLALSPAMIILAAAGLMNAWPGHSNF